MRQFNTASQNEGNVMTEGGFPLHEGEHPFIITATEVKATKANDGSEYLMIKATVDGGVQQGSEFMIFLNLWNNNSLAVDIAEKEFNTLRIACGFGNQVISEPNQLLNCRATAQVSKKKSGKSKGELFISGYVSAQAQAPQQPVQTQQQSVPQQPVQTQQQSVPQQPAPAQNAGGNTPPWG